MLKALLFARFALACVLLEYVVSFFLFCPSGPCYVKTTLRGEEMTLASVGGRSPHPRGGDGGGGGGGGAVASCSKNDSKCEPSTSRNGEEELGGVFGAGRVRNECAQQKKQHPDRRLSGGLVFVRKSAGSSL